MKRPIVVFIGYALALFELAKKQYAGANVMMIRPSLGGGLAGLVVRGH